MKFDDLLVTLSEFGPAQRRLYLYLSLPAIFSTIVSIAVVVFLFAIPLHRCAISGMENDTYAVQSETHSIAINHTFPLTYDEHGEIKYSSCDLYVYSSENNISGNASEPCDKWVYDKSVYTSTVSQSLDLVCSRISYSTHSKSVAMAGKLVGVLVSGPLSDRFGRRKVILGSVSLAVLLSICFTWVNNFYLMILMVFIIMFCATTQYLSCFVFSMEIVGPSKRMLTGVAINLFWSIGNMIVALFAFLLREWRTRQLVLSVPAILLAYLYFIPESPRWLLRRGKTQEARKILVKFAKQNKVVLPADSFNEILITDDGPREEFWELLRSSIMMKRLLIISYNWFAIGMCFYGLTMNVTNLSGNIYLNFFLFVILEAFAYIACLFLIKRIQRKRMLCGSMLLAGTSCILTFVPFLVTPKPNKWIVNSLACLGNTCVSAGFAVVYVFTAELMPTTSRNFGMGISSTACRVGSILAPYINDLTLHVTGRYGQILPMLIFGGVATMAGLLALLLPETQNRRLPEVIQEAENLGRPGFDFNRENETDLTMDKDIKHRKRKQNVIQRTDVL